MISVKEILAGAAGACAAILLVACGDASGPAEESAEQMGQQMEETTEEARQGFEEAGESVSRAAEEAGDRVESATE